ncbi:MAG: 1-acyl-sn-glycerol-3-phosphate acyltransferase [Polyangiaceae bacterium]
MIRIAPKPLPSTGALREAMRALAEQRKVRARASRLDARDPAFIERLLPLMDLFYDHYFRCETELECEVPEGPVLGVANHNGMTGTPDMFCLMTAYWRRYGTARRAYGLMHDFPFRVPWAGPWLNGCGAIAANHDNATEAFRRGAQLLVFPGGDIDACRPFRKRYDIELAGRRGFLRLALRAQVPVLPIVSVGGHESLYLFSSGRGIAEALRLPELLRSNVFPIGFALPWGVIFGNPVPHLPPPVKIHTRFCAPIDLGLPPEAADDEEALNACYQRVVGAMQAAMNELRDQGRHGLFPKRA